MGAELYYNALKNAFNGHINVGTNGVTAALVKSTHAAAIATANTWSDISADESSGTNYSAGGVSVPTPALTVTVANSWSTVAATTTAYAVGDVVRPAVGNGFLYRCEAAGTSGASAPTWPTVLGATVTDGTVTWTCIGKAIVQLTGGAFTYSNVSITDYEFIEFRDPTTGYLIAEHDLGSAQNVTASNVTYTPDALGIAWHFIA